MIRPAVLVLAALLVAACGSRPAPTPLASPSAATATPTAPTSVDASASQPASEGGLVSRSARPSDAPSARPPSTRPSVAALDLPDTTVTATIDQPYNTSGDPFRPADLGGVEPGDVTARWYVEGDRWVVHYDGLDADATGPLCLGNSAQTAAGFEHVSNAPTEAGACEHFDGTLATDPVGVRRCGEDVLYLTAIPADVEGVLYASIETQYQTPGSVVGLTSVADPAGAAPPKIDLDDPACEVVLARP
jgi:hypothetical protein